MARSRRPDGRIQIQVDLGVADGKRKRKSFYGATAKEAREARDAWLADQERKARVTAADPDVTLEKWSELWLASIAGTTETNTYKQRASAVKQQNKADIAGARFGDFKVKDIRQLHIQTYLNGLSGRSKGTIRLRRATLHAIIRTAQANGIIDRSPWIEISCPRGTYKGHRALEENEQRLVEDACGGHRCGIWALTMMYTGMRPEEASAQDIEDIDFADDLIHIHDAAVLSERGRLKETKTEAGVRSVPILPQLKPALQAFIGDRKTGRLFLSANGEPLTETAFRRGWESYLRYLNLHEGGTDTKRGKNENGKPTWIPAKIVIKRFTPYDLRDTYATILYDAGVDVKTAAVLLGHKDITVTMAIYTKLSARKKAQGIDALLSYMKEKDKPNDEK